MIVVGLAAAALTGAWGAPPASAHATLVRAVPGEHARLERAPTALLLFFDQRVAIQFSRVTVTAAGDDADLVAGPLRELGTEVLVPLRPGPKDTYTVRWRMLSAGDGHVVQGAFSYGVGVTPGAPKAFPASGPPVGPDLLRWLVFLGLALTGGALVVRAAVWRPALADASLSEESVGPQWKRSATVALVGAVVALHAELYAFLVSAHSVTGGPLRDFTDAQIQPLRAGTRFGVAWTWTTFVWLAVIGLIVAAWIGEEHRRERLLAAAGVLALVGGLGLSTSGHAAAGSDVRMGADFLHLMAAALWAGGLIELAALAVSTKRLPAITRRALTAACLRRFSALALWLVVALAVAGLYLALVQAPWPASFGRAWGEALIAKTTLAAGALALGAFHRWKVVPRMRATDGPAIAGVTRTLAAEAALVAAALLAAAVLTNLAPRA
jgi:copper transport protein